MNPTPAAEAYSTMSSGASQDDVALLRRMAAGDEGALGALYDRWHPLVHGVVMRILRSADEAEDVVEEAFWQAWRQAPRYEATRGTVQTWLLTIARSRALDRVRTLERRREDPIETESGNQVAAMVSDDAGPALNAEAEERRRIIVSALAELPAEQREAVELGYFAGLSQSEIADRTGQPLGTVKTRMRLAMQKLRGRLTILREEAR